MYKFQANTGQFDGEIEVEISDGSEEDEETSDDGIMEPPAPQMEAEDLNYTESLIESVRIAQIYIEKIKSASLDSDKLTLEEIHRLRNPDTEPVDLDNPDARLSIDIYMACSNASESTYTAVRKSVLRRFPDVEILSYHRVKALVADITGVTSIADDMCINSCTAFTGPYEDAIRCPQCAEPRFDPNKQEKSNINVPRQRACTIPLGPQLQALRRSTTGAEELRYRDRKTASYLKAYDEAVSAGDLVYDDIFTGADFISLADQEVDASVPCQ